MLVSAFSSIHNTGGTLRGVSHTFSQKLICLLQYLTYETQKMSAIFPTKPPKATLHFVPKDAEFISYDVDDTLVLSAWMSDGFHTVDYVSDEDDDDFFERHCDDCERNCYSFLEQFMDEDGDIDYCAIPGGNCGVYDEGYHGQHCPKGHEKEKDEFSFPISNMVFSINLSHLGKGKRFSRMSDTAYLSVGEVTCEGKIKRTATRMASNVYGDSEFPQGICWGYNSKPDNLSEIVSEYVSTPFNNDLLSIGVFETNCRFVRCDTNKFEDTNKYLCSGKSALLLLDASENLSAFFQMISAGFTSLPEAPHIMILPLNEKTITMGTDSISGYCTDLDAVGKSWFVTNSGEILGQVDGF